MLRSLALVAGTIILAGCSVAAAPSIDPTTAPPSSPILSPTPTGSSGSPAPSSPIGACAGDSWDDDLDPSMTLGGTPFRFQYQSASPLDDSASGWSDSVPGPTLRFGIGDVQAVEAASGSSVRLQPADVVAFTDARMELYALDADDQVDDSATPVDSADLAVVDGALTVPLPTAAGRWLLSVYGRWQTACAGGDGYVDLLLVTT